MKPLLLAALCGRYETVDFLLNRGHKLQRPHPPKCMCDECLAMDNVVAAGTEKLNTYRALSSPTYLCRTSATDPILACFRLHDELLERGAYEQVYETAYTSLALQVKQFAVSLIVNCRTSDEVKVLLRNRDGCKFRGAFPYPRLITAMDHKQKEFVGHSSIQQLLESVWIGDWIEWKSYSTLRKCAYPAWRLLMLPLTILLAVLAPSTSMSRDSRLPIKRMFDNLAMYCVFLALLFVQSNADRFETRRGMPIDSVPWLLIAVFVISHAVEKIKLRLLQGPQRFFGNLWNVFDTVKLTLFTVAYLAWAVAGLQARWVDDDLDRKYWHWADPQLVAEGLFAVATVMAFLRLLFLCRLNYYIGPMQVSLGKMLNDFGKFATFLAIIMVAFTCGLGTLYSPYKDMERKDPETGQVTRQEDSFVTVADTFKTLFWGIFCMTPLEAPNVVVGSAIAGGDADVDVQSHDFTQLVGYGLFAAFEVMMVIVMLNMLIASMSDTFQRVADNSDYEWLFGRTKVYLDYMLLDDLPPPFNLLPTVTGVMRVMRRLLSVSAGFEKFRDLADDANDDDDGHHQEEYRVLMVQLIKRYFIRMAQINRSD
uniref:Short transient receptor potential channel 3 n=1 Tax=Sipha flava TaxID=143950 RepID=A0A2S2QFU4_9HEMI